MPKDFQATTWEVEDMILGMAEIVMECRQLRREVAELREFKDKYYEEVNQRFKDSQMHSMNMLKLAIAISEKEEASIKNKEE